MPITVSQQYKIDPKAFAQTGAFDAILDVDSKLFIDPHLLRRTTAPELAGAHQHLTEAFGAVLQVLRHSKRKGDSFWRQADRLLTFPELKGLCIGYSAKGTDGSGMGPVLRAKLLETAKEIVDAGIVDPTIFELMGLLEENVGADRISDMVGRIIRPDLYAYSQRIFRQFGVPTRRVALGQQVYELAKNPYNGQPIILVPRDVLRALPVAMDWDDIDSVTGFNQSVRAQVNRLVGRSWRRSSRRRRPTKPEVRSVMLSHPEVLRQLLKYYEAAPGQPYDFEGDPEGQVAWVQAAVEYVGSFPLPIDLPSNPVASDVFKVALAIGERFKELIENNGLSSLLYNEAPKVPKGQIKGKLTPKHEEAAQKVFYGIADAYCRASNIDLSAEADGGRGPVDFKVSRGYTGRVLVEAKLTTNKQLLHGFETQLGEYEKAEKTHLSVYLVIDVAGGSKLRLQKLLLLAKKARDEGKRVPHIIVVDARPKPSASKFKAA